MCYPYNPNYPNSIDISTFFEQIRKVLDICNKKYEDILQMGNYTVDIKKQI